MRLLFSVLDQTFPGASYGEKPLQVIFPSRLDIFHQAELYKQQQQQQQRELLPSALCM